jgi:hypothetical protein
VELVVLVVLLGAGAVAALLAYRRFQRGSAGPAPTVASTPAERAARHARQTEVETRGEELLERRVSLDSKRGTLGGDNTLYDALDELQKRRQEGQISEVEFEREKVRLLSGPERS